MKCLVLFAVFGFASGSMNAALKAGDSAPEIHFDKLLPEQPAGKTTFQALAGKAVVLEIWATWCGPCVAAIPHINELSGKFKDRPVVFLSVTDEEPAVVESFLRKRPISGLVGIAHTQAPEALYGVGELPVTFLIDGTGKIAGSTDPDLLSSSMLEDLIAGRPLVPVELSIRQTRTTDTASLRLGWNSIVTKGMRLQPIISVLWDVRQSRIVGLPLDGDYFYELSLSVPGATAATFNSWAGDILAAALHIKVAREVRETEVWVLAKTSVTPAALRTPGGIAASPLVWIPATPPATGGALKLANTSVPDIAMFMENVVGKPVLDETGLTGRYDFTMPYEKDDPQGRIDGLRKAGFEVEVARRRIEFVIVSRIE